MIEEKSVQTVYLGLGCNLGNRLESLEKAILMLGEIGEVVSKSKIYESPAWGYVDERAYLNMCCALQTKVGLEELHQRTLEIEVALGRETSKRKQGEPFRPRMIDIDILFFGDEVIETDSLTIPHSQLHLRNFVLLPMVDIAPEYKHPLLGQSMLELCFESKDNSEPVQLS
ncbi:2-amino-4-hydroxy-6-hydroxymethyldihydropteridine diphosphokinase [Cryomorphaceae bacterium 1068]|nr:2-amino-4-hydroxy-6-hydroxymethyldihydropteridine diphosphokinase [Cryomorphaceae bacterium 1068]